MTSDQSGDGTLAQATAQVSDTLQRASWSGAAEGVRHLFELRRGRGTFTDARAGEDASSLLVHSQRAIGSGR